MPHVNYGKLFPFHFLFIPVHFIWHACNAYFGLIPFAYWSLYLLYYSGLSLFLFVAGKILLKKNDKAGVWAAVLLIVFFFWGSAQDFLNTHLTPFFSSYKFLLPLIFISLVIWTIRLKRKNSTIKKTNLFLNILILFLLLIEGGTSLFKVITKEVKKNNFAYYNTPIQPAFIVNSDSLKPDIFYIFFDEYASTRSLKQYLDFDNSRFDSMLVKNNFYIASGSKSNYNATPLSIGSAFFADYFNVSIEGKKIFPKELLQAQFTIKQAPLPYLLKSQGYSIKNYGLCDINGQTSPEEPWFNPEIRDILHKETFWGRIKEDIIWNLPFDLPALLLPDKEMIKRKNVLRRNRNNYKNLINELSTQNRQPKFVYGHVMMPHGRYYLNKKGEQRNVYKGDESPGIRDSLYLDQLIYTNTWIESIASAANQEFSRPRVVVIQGDHGRRDEIPYHPVLQREKQFMNLNCFYFSDKNYAVLYDSISTVNTFRVILNKYFGESNSLLKDSSIRAE